MTTTISAVFRYVSFQVCRTVGSIYYWLRTDWRPAIIWLTIITLIVCLPDYIDQTYKTTANTWYERLSMFTATVGSVLSAQWRTVLASYTLLLLLWWAWQAKKRVVIEGFMDYTINPPQSDARGIATLLVVKLAQLQELFRVVDEQRALATEAKSNQPIDATIKVEDASEFLSSAISAQSKFSLGPLEIPVGMLLSLIGRLVQGPRILGSLHKDKGILILTTQRLKGHTATSWRVDRKISSPTVDQDTYNLNDMIEELAYRMYTDLALSGSVRWRATATFSEGLQCYRDCLRTPKDRKIKLKLAEKKFIETLAEDREFASANYNLGVLYMELNQVQAAEEAFFRAVSQNPSSWRSYYALAVCRCQLGQYQSVISLCDHVNERVITDKPGMANLAKVYHTKGVAQTRSLLRDQNDSLLSPILQEDKDAIWKQRLGQQDEVEPLQSQVDFLHRQNKIIALNGAIQSYKKAVAYSWRALCRAECLKKGVTKTENRVIPQREAVASVCLIDLAIAYSEQGKEWSGIASYYDGQIENCGVYIKSDKKHARQYRARQRDDIRHKLFSFGQAKALFKRAEKLFYFATFLTSSNTITYQALVDQYTHNYFTLANMYYAWGKYDEAIEEYLSALRINPEVAECWAYLALAYAEFSQTQLITLPTTANFNKVQAKLACEKALSYLSTSSPVTLKNTLERILKTYVILCEEGNKDIVEYMITLLDEYMKLIGIVGNGSIHDGMESTTFLVHLEEHFSDSPEEKQAGKRALAWIGAQIFLTLGRLSLDSNKPEEAEKDIKRANRLLEKSFPHGNQTQALQALLVYALLNQKKHEEALQVAEDALILVPHGYFEREALGDAYFTRNRFKDAIETWQDALLRRDAFMRKLPDWPKLDTSAMHFSIGASFLPKKDALDIHYKIGISYVKLAEHIRSSLKRSEALKQAILYLDQANTLYDGDKQQEKRAIHYFLGFLHLELGEYEDAIFYLQAAKTTHFVRLTSLFYLGYAYLKNKDYDGALKQFMLLLEEAGQQEGQSQLNDLIEAEYVGFMYLGEILAMARWGIAFTNAERNTNLLTALEIVETAQGYIDELLQLKCQLHFPADCQDCKGWILLKLGSIDDAISSLQQAVALSSNPKGYLHLALAYERKLQGSKNDANLLHEIQICCQYIQELDFRKEYTQQASEILERHPAKPRPIEHKTKR